MEAFSYRNTIMYLCSFIYRYSLTDFYLFIQTHSLKDENALFHFEERTKLFKKLLIQPIKESRPNTNSKLIFQLSP